MSDPEELEREKEINDDTNQIAQNAINANFKSLNVIQISEISNPPKKIGKEDLIKINKIKNNTIVSEVMKI